MSYKDYHIILASNSPRRRELLRGLDIAFDVRVQPDIAEHIPKRPRLQMLPAISAAKRLMPTRTPLRKTNSLLRQTRW